MRILVTGAAGFIGYHLSKRLAERGDEVLGLDIVNDYYDPDLKLARLETIGINRSEIENGKIAESHSDNGFRFVKLDLTDRDKLLDLFENEPPFDAVVNLAAQAGVRYSLINPFAYGESNLIGFLNLLEGCRRSEARHLVYASTSSVYGLNEKKPFSVREAVNHPVSLYAATKKANELMAHSYSDMFGLPTTGLRFFTVYGPWGRPDMALFLFTKAILAGKPIQVFNFGDMARDFTYIDDIVTGVVKVVDKPARPSDDWNPLAPDPSISRAPYRVFNIGNGAPVKLLDYIKAIEHELGREAELELLPMQPGDFKESHADVTELKEEFDYKPDTPVAVGIKNFIAWYRDYYKV